MEKALEKLNKVFSQAKEKRMEKDEAIRREAITIEEVIRRYEELLS